MKLENSFTVAAPLEQTWDALLDIERLAACLPGAKIEPGVEDGVHRGAMEMKLGPATVGYRGTARLQDVDEDTHTASIALQAREAEGQGTAAAVISNHLEAQNGSTTVVAVTDLNLTGAQAKLGRGAMEDAAEAISAEFAQRLEAEVKRAKPAPAARAAASAGTAGTGAQAPPPSAGPAPEQEEGGLDLGGALMDSPVARYGGIAAAVALLLLVLSALLRGRRRQYTFNLDLRR